MEELSREKRKLEGDFLPEILQEIFQYLNIQDLCRAATVNKLWNEVATRERERRGLEIILISLSNANIYDTIKSKPYVTLMFVALKGIHEGVRPFQLDVLRKYKGNFPNHLMLVDLPGVIMNEQLITCDNKLSKGSILSVLIPKYRDLKIRVNYFEYLDDTENYSEFVKEFLPEDSQSKTVVIVFSQYPRSNENLFKLLHKNMTERQQRYSLWGVAFGDAPFISVNCQMHTNSKETDTYQTQSIDYDSMMGPNHNGIFAMSFTGLCLTSWSLVISCDTIKQEFDRKLIDFRDHLQPKRRTIGLVCGPSLVFYKGRNVSDVYKTFEEMMHAVKKVFTDVHLTGIYDTSERNYFYGYESEIDDSDPQFEHLMSLCLMILTFE